MHAYNYQRQRGIRTKSVWVWRPLISLHVHFLSLFISTFLLTYTKNRDTESGVIITEGGYIVAIIGILLNIWVTYFGATHEYEPLPTGYLLARRKSLYDIWN